MTVSDTLSWNPAFSKGDMDEELTLLLPNHLFVSNIDLPLHHALQSATELDPSVRDALRDLQKKDPVSLLKGITDWKEQEGLIFFHDRCYVPLDAALCHQIVEKYHNLGHDGTLQTLEHIRPCTGGQA